MLRPALRLPLALALVALAAGPACQCGSAGIRSRAPRIEVVPPALAFQPIPVGRNDSKFVEVRNSGNDTLHFQKDPSLAESDGDGLQELATPSILNKDCSGGSRTGNRLDLEPGECARIVVRYEPADAAGSAGQLTLETDDPENAVVKVPIGLSDPAKLKVCTLKADGSTDLCDAADGTPPTLDFGLVAKGQSLVRKVRLINDGTVRLENLAVLAPDGPSRSEYARDATAVTSTLEVGKSVDVQVRFTPTKGGQRTAWVEVQSNDARRDPIKVPVSGNGEGPGLCAVPNPVEFGSAGVGVKVDKTLALKSCGTVPVQLQQVEWDLFSSPAFTAVTALPGPRTMNPGDVVNIGLRMQADELGELTAGLLVKNDGDPSQMVQLHGTSVDLPACRLTAVDQVDFGQVVRGTTASRQVSVTNKGKLDCKLSKASITAGSAYYSVQNAPSAVITLRPGDAYTVDVRYAPPASSASTAQTGTLTFDSDDPANPKRDVRLTGLPVAAPECKLAITPTGSGGIGGLGGRILNFGTVVIGRDKVLPVSFRNIGSAACTLSNIKLAGQFGLPGSGSCSARDCGDYHIVAPNAATPIAPGQSTTVNVSFKPLTINQPGGSIAPTTFLYTDTNAAQVNAQGTPECAQGFPPNTSLGCVGVGLVGQGDISNLAVLPSDLDFGLITLGCSAREETVTLYNTGRTVAITIKSITLDPTTAPFYVTAPPTPFTIAAGQSVKFKVKYRPTAAQRETAVLRIENDAANTSSQNPYVTVGLSGTGTTDKHQKDTFTQATQPLVDLLFVMDNSGSMGGYQSKLSQEAPKFVQAALSKNVDYHFGVTTSDADVDGDEKADSEASAPYRNKPYYVGGLFGSGIVTNATPSAADRLVENIKVGTCCSDSREASLEAAWLALTPNANTKPPPQGSQGFLRDAARLVMLNVTDEEDQSRSTAAFYTDFFQQLKGRYNAGLVSWNTISGDEQKGCSANGVSAAANDLGWKVARDTGGKAYSLCSADWTQIAGELALDAFNGRKQFPLTRVADPATLVVTLNGAAQTSPANYTFDQASNSVVFVVAPPPGASIVAEYDALCF